MVRVILLATSLMLIPVFAEDMNPQKEESDRYFQEQVQKLNYGSTKEKKIAVENLRRIKSKRALRPFIFALRGSSTYGEPKKGVVQPETPEVDQPLVNVELKEHNDPALKFVLAQAIADIGSERGMSALVDVYKALEPLVKKEEKVNLPYSDDMNNVNAATEILRSIGKLVHRLEETQEADASKYKPVNDAIKSGMETLKAALAHEHHYIRSGAADGLAYSSRPEALESVNGVLEKEEDEYTKAALLSAIIALNKGNGEKFFDLVELLRSDKPAVRIRASIGISFADVSNGAHYIKEALQYEENFNVREQMKRDARQWTHDNRRTTIDARQ